MTTNQAKSILQRISEVSDDLRELRRVEREIYSSGTASATLSSGGGSKSYTHLDLGTVGNLIRQKESELAALRARLNGAPAIRRIMFAR